MSASPNTSFDRREYQRRFDDAESLQYQGRYREAAALLRKNLASSTQHLGVRHVETLNDRDCLSDCLHDLGEYAEAVALDKETLGIRKKTDEQSQLTLATQHSLANNLSELGQYKESIALYRSVLACRTEVLGDHHNDTLETRHQLAYSLHRHGQDQEALQLNTQTLIIRERRLAPDDYELIATRHNLATNLHALKNFDKAMALTDQNLVLLRGTKPAADQPLQEVKGLKERIKSDILGLKRSKKASQEKEVVDKQAEKVNPERRPLRQAEEALEKTLTVPEKPNKRRMSHPEEKSIGKPGKVETSSTKGEVHSIIVASIAPVKTSSQTPRPTSAPEKKTANEKTGGSSSGNSRETETPSKKEKTRSMTVPPAPAVYTSPRTPSPTSNHSKKTDDSWSGRSKKIETPLKKDKSLSNAVPSTPADNTSPRTPSPTSNHSKRTEDSSSGKSRRIEKPLKKDKSLSITVPPTPAANTSSQTPHPTSGHSKTTRGDEIAIPLRESSPTRKHRAGSNERKSHNEPTTSDLRVPSTREQRSRSVGASSSEQGETVFQRSRVYTFSNLCDSRPYEGSLSDTTYANSKSGWFTCLKDTQSLVAQGRKNSGKRVRIAILDTGIDLAHSQFDKLDDAHPENGSPRDRVRGCVSFVDGQKADHDTSGHGTHSAALLLAIAPGAQIYVGGVVEEKSEHVSPEVIAKAITHATDKWKVNIITMSFGWSHHHPIVERAIEHATTKDVIMCAAASNNGAIKNVTFPASFPPVVCVHSANEQGKPSDFTPSALEMIPNFLVLGENIRSTWPGERERARSGTSTATPILAAIMALVLEFMYQKQKKTPQDWRLKTARGMTHLLQAMSKQERGYHLVQPWTVYDFKKERTRVESRISDIMEEKFPEE